MRVLRKYKFLLVFGFLSIFPVNGKYENRENDERILSRNRRWLIFPEGSNFQLGMYHS